jgi:hypothetical protein
MPDASLIRMLLEAGLAVLVALLSKQGQPARLLS